MAIDPPRSLTVRLRRDSLGTQSGVLRHRCELRLVREDAFDTKLVLRMSARFRGLQLPLLRRLSPESLRPRLLDLAMRSVKLAVGAAPRASDADGRLDQPVPSVTQPLDALAVTPAQPPPSLGDRV